MTTTSEYIRIMSTLSLQMGVYKFILRLLLDYLVNSDWGYWHVDIDIDIDMSIRDMNKLGEVKNRINRPDMSSLNKTKQSDS